MFPDTKKVPSLSTDRQRTPFGLPLSISAIKVDLSMFQIFIFFSTPAEIAKALGITLPTAKLYVKKAIENNEIEALGTSKNVIYKIKDNK